MLAELEVLYQNELEWCHRRLLALEKIEDRLKEMRELAVYTASRVLSKEDATQVQEWMSVLKAEVEGLDKETADKCSVWDGVLICSDKQNYGRFRFYS